MYYFYPSSLFLTKPTYHEKKDFFFAACLCLSQAAQSQQCDETYLPIKEPEVRKVILFQSKGTLNRKDLLNKNQVGQSFLVTAPYLKKITTDFVKPAGSVAGNVTVRLYVFDSENHPAHRDRVLWETTVSINSWNNEIIPSHPIYVKPGLQYYLSFENLSSFDVIKYRRDYNPHGSMYINGVKNIEYDLNVEIEGGYPMEGYKNLMVYNHYEPVNSDPNSTRHFTCHEVGQTFIATTPYLKSVKFASGANPNENAVIKVYEFDEVTQRRNYKQVGEAATIQMGFNSATTFDWETNGKSMPFLKVGRKYYVEITKEKTDEYTPDPDPVPYRNFHVYAHTVNAYDFGELFIDGKKVPTNDLFLEMVGIDPNAKKEIVVNTINYNDTGWLVWYPAVGQTFKATTSYIHSVTGTFCNPSTGNLRIYRFSGNADPRGVLIKELLNISFNACGQTVIDFDPIPTIPGQDYYVEFSSVNYSTSMSIYGPDYKTEDNYMYGNTYFRNTNGSYSISTQPGPVNITINGVKTGMPYIGWGVAINDHSGFDFNGSALDYNLRFNHFVNSIEQKAIAYNDIGAYWIRFSMPIDDSLMANLHIADVVFDNIENKNIGGMIWILGFGHLLPNNDPTWEFTEDFYNLAELYANRAAILAERYKGRNIIWEILNEPFYHGAPIPEGHPSVISFRQYTYLVQITSKKIKEKDPSAVIAGGCLSHMSEWASNFTIVDEIGDYIDIYSYHPYHEVYPESKLERWTKTRRLEFAKHTKTSHIPTLTSSEYGPSQREWNLPTAFPQISDEGYYEHTPFMYYVQRNSPDNYVSTQKFIGQTFKATSNTIEMVSLNVDPLTTGLSLSIYDYSGNSLSPRGLLKGVVPQSTEKPEAGFAEFKVYNSPIELTVGNLYYLEFSRPTNQTFSAYGNNASLSGSNDYIKYVKVNNSPAVDFDGQALSWDGVSANYSALAGDLNMKIWKIDIIKDRNFYNITPYMYHVNITGTNTYNQAVKFAGQTFKCTGQSIKWVSVNVAANTGGLRLTLYKYSDNPLNPKGTLVGSVDQTGTATNGIAEFTFINSPITLKIDQVYYLEIFKVNSTTFNIIGNDYSKTQSNEYLKVDFDGQAYTWTGVVNTNYTTLPGDINMKIWKAGMVGVGYIFEETPFISIPVCTTSTSIVETRLVGPYSENIQAVVHSRYLLNQIKNNVPLSVIYKEGDDQGHQGVFYPDRWLSPLVFTYKFYKKPNAHMVKNLSDYFGEAFSEPSFRTWAASPNAQLNHVAKYNEATKTLVIALWLSIPAESNYKEAISLGIGDSTFATTPVTHKVYSDIINPVMGEQQGVWLDGSSGTTLVVNNIMVGSQPVILTIDLP